MGRTQRGSITGILTILLDADDANDPVADKDVVWYGGTSFTGGGNPALTGDSRTLFVVNPDTYVALPLTPSAGANPGQPAGGAPFSSIVSVWSRFAYLPAYDAYAVIPDVSTNGVYVFAPDRTSGPLAGIRGR